MRSKGTVGVVAAVVVLVVLVVVVAMKKGSQKIQRSSTPVHVSAPAGTATAPATNVTGVFTGPTIEMEYGPVQVAIDVQGGKIVDIKALQYPVDRPRSQFINEQAVPLLRSEVLQAQNANINVISGATFTTNAFVESLQAAIGQETKGAAVG